MRRGTIWLAALLAVFVAPLVALEVAVRLAAQPSLARLDDRSPAVLDDRGGLLRAFLSKDHRWRLRTTARDVPPELVAMLLAYEDKRFHRHDGIDHLALVRAAAQLAVSRRVLSGGSTLTMQVARLLEPSGRGLRAKLRQVVAARQLERRHSKAAILDMYLTLAPFGGNIEGVRAASLAYFGKEPKSLTFGEQAMLVALPQSPERRRPDLHPGEAKRARDRVLARAQEAGKLPAKVMAEARREMLRVTRRPLIFAGAHVAEHLVRRHPAETTIASLIDTRLQQSIERLLAQHESVRGSEMSAAAIVVRNADLAVRAYAGGTGYLTDTRAGQIDLVRAVRSPGSVLKPVVYGMGFERLLIHPATIITDAPVRFSAYEPKNFSDDFHGDMTVRDALIRSVNTAAVSVLARIGPETMMTRLRSTGLRLRIDETDAQAGLSIALGGCGMTLADVAQLYAGLANGGMVRPLRYTPKDAWERPHRLLTPDAAWAVTDILANLPPPDGFVARTSADGRRRLAYKTGTSYSFRDAWSAGFDGLHTVAVWIGRPDGAPAPGNIGRQAAAPLLFAIMDQLPQPPQDVAGIARAGNPFATSRSLPSRLQRFGDPAGAQAARSAAPLKIAFPHDGSRVMAGASRVTAGGGSSDLPLIAQGGAKPLFWYVDGRLIPGPGETPEVRWRPDGPGQVRVTVLDSAGQTASADFWVE